MNKLTTEQYAAARRMIDEEIIGAFIQHKGKILDSWYDKLASVLQMSEPESTKAITVTFPKPGVYRVEGDGSFNFIGSGRRS
jgi:hypothetical protein